MKAETYTMNMAIKKEKIEAVAVCCLFSYLFAGHEIRVREIFKNLLPNVKISLSHEVFPRWREYERASTTIIDAFLKPSVSAYVNNLQNGLKKNNFHSNLLKQVSNNILKKPINKEKSLILIGPEGDFSNTEKDLILKNNFKSISLGSSILRTETAAIVG